MMDAENGSISERDLTPHGQEHARAGEGHTHTDFPAVCVHQLFEQRAATSMGIGNSPIGNSMNAPIRLLTSFESLA
jgi:hypothetical protein